MIKEDQLVVDIKMKRKLIYSWHKRSRIKRKHQGVIVEINPESRMYLAMMKKVKKMLMLKLTLKVK